MLYLTLIIAWLVYFFLHSALAADAVKTWACRTLHLCNKNYRMLYNTIAAGGLALIIYFILLISDRPLFKPGWLVNVLAWLCLLSGAYVFHAAFRQYHFSPFIGLTDENENKLNTGGILNRIRHPLYTATILWVTAYALWVPAVSSFISVACIFIYLPVGIWLEERKLIKRFGSDYLNYRKRVPALIPQFRLMTS